jgi:hypothetical protein
MDRYLVEVPHEAGELACAQVVRTFLDTGSHYLTQADWGCQDGEHKAWMIVEAADRDEARSIVPPPLRTAARVVRLNKFDSAQIDEIVRRHGE